MNSKDVKHGVDQCTKQTKSSKASQFINSHKQAICTFSDGGCLRAAIFKAVVFLHEERSMLEFCLMQLPLSLALHLLLILVD